MWQKNLIIVLITLLMAPLFSFPEDIYTGASADGDKVISQELAIPVESINVEPENKFEELENIEIREDTYWNWCKNY